MVSSSRGKQMISKGNLDKVTPTHHSLYISFNFPSSVTHSGLPLQAPSLVHDSLELNRQLRDRRREHVVKRLVRRQRALLTQIAFGHLRRDVVVHCRGGCAAGRYAGCRWANMGLIRYGVG